MMKTPIGTYDRFSVVAVPFPFTDSAWAKKRPALVLSSAGNFGGKIGHSVMAMITSANNAPWPLDIRIHDLAAAGLTAESIIRMKLFTLDHRLIDRLLGRLSAQDITLVTQSLHELLGT
jgi:mRNA interferase MazF